ncbi:type IV pilin protein [uncultured Tolumonas sp.]|uniref:type IV pilin protein n=1 Tax=uncultured Tolumonas sp. TaxID=263765 RepID=UPI00292EE4FA|nr:type IV pilin protein [uncultured Tolumonas sp.]
MKVPAGICLTDLVIAMVMILILSVITYPSYQSYLRVSHRSDAHIGLLKLAGMQEQFFLHAQQYTTLNNLHLVSGADSYLTEQGFYRITASVTPSSYLLTATAIGSQASDTECQTLTLAQDGSRDSTSHERCW